jgi:nitrate/TMAO reductase-like tetraheme cytochrome c subunit
MPESVPPLASGAPARRSNFNNWISAIGGVLSVGALFSFALFVWMDFTQGQKSPYLAILTYIVVPVVLIAGLATVFGGALAQRRWMIKHAHIPDKWRLDFAEPTHRRWIMLFGIGGVGFIMLTAFGSYQTYHYSESVTFCGEVCHAAMNPELVTYRKGAHARVECVECHIGTGAQWFVKAKVNGTQQLIAFTLDNYKRPIETPIKNLRPAQDTCEQCHWPQKFAGNVEINFEHFLSDKKNTPYQARLLLHVNQSASESPIGGIHWHVSSTERVEYYAADAKRQDIPWMRVVNSKDGTSRVYRIDSFKGEPPADQLRVMDCMDCHNRPAHKFPTANDAVEKSLAAGTLSTKLPNIKRVAVQAMTQKEITSSTEAPQKIADFVRAKFTDATIATEVPGTIAEIQRLYAETIFSERKADWRIYPDNIGHKDWPGCFRCHDDKHKTSLGQTVRSSDCTSCHTLITQGKGTELETFSAKGLTFMHPGGELDPDLTCADCHNGGIQK